MIAISSSQLFVLSFILALYLVLTTINGYIFYQRYIKSSKSKPEADDANWHKTRHVLLYRAVMELCNDLSEYAPSLESKGTIQRLTTKDLINWAKDQADDPDNTQPHTVFEYKTIQQPIKRVKVISE